MFHQTVHQVAHFIILSALGFIDTYLAIIVPTLAGTLGVYLMKQFFESSVSDAVLESARLDGASEFRTFLTIAMPTVPSARHSSSKFTERPPEVRKFIPTDEKAEAFRWARLPLEGRTRADSVRQSNYMKKEKCT